MSHRATLWLIFALGATLTLLWLWRTGQLKW
jgi:hypothetical protein